MAVPTPSSPEHVRSQVSSPEQHSLIVAQPEKLGSILDAIENLTGPRETPTEKQGESGGAGSAVAVATTTHTTLSSRDIAIANLPRSATMHRALQKHIEAEVRRLRREASRITASRPGAAFRLNRIYANIRTLNKLLLELLHTSYETLKLFFIRVFIDRQAIL